MTGETEKKHGRATAFDANPNNVAAVLSLGFIAVFSLAYGREKTEWKTRLLFWTTSVILAAAIVRTGSRGSVLALALTFGVLLFKKADIQKKFKLLLFGLIGISVLAGLSYQVPAVRERWEETLMEGDLAGRNEIYAEALSMVLDRPLLGWGPVNHSYELGSRLGMARRDTHNLYLYILTEVGVLGSIPFFLCLWTCWRAAWKSRFTIQGVAPLMMLSFFLMINMKGSYQNKKLFWFVLAYALASGAYSTVNNWSRNKSYRSSRIELRPV
jgi:O-antigen ligase